MKQLVMAISGAVSLGLAGSVWAMPEFTLTIKDHKFEPSTLHVPAHTRFRLIVKNMDPTPEEFESEELHREKIIRGNSQGVVFIGPLDPGTYPFMGEFHATTAKGQIIVK